MGLGGVFANLSKIPIYPPLEKGDFGRTSALKSNCTDEICFKLTPMQAGVPGDHLIAL